jgi:ribosomal protein S24E
MKIVIKDEKKEELLSRKKVLLEITYKGSTPSKEEILKHAASTVKVESEKIIIKKVQPIFGEQKSLVYLHVYDNVDLIKKIEIIKEKKKEE